MLIIKYTVIKDTCHMKIKKMIDILVEKNYLLLILALLSRFERATCSKIRNERIKKIQINFC